MICPRCQKEVPKIIELIEESYSTETEVSTQYPQGKMCRKCAINKTKGRGRLIKGGITMETKPFKGSLWFSERIIGRGRTGVKFEEEKND